MFDFLDKFKSIWTPDKILNEPDVTLIEDSGSVNLASDLELAQTLCDHLNEMQEWKNRIESLDWLASQARQNFDNIAFTTIDESLINSIIKIGGSDGTVDFQLAKTSMELLFDWYDITAMKSLTGVE